MPNPLTIQIQLEPDLELSDEYLLRCRKVMVDAALAIECLGFVRYQMCLGSNVVEPK